MERLYHTHSPLHDFFDKEEINKWIQTKRKSTVWSFLVLDEWFRQNEVVN